MERALNDATVGLKVWSSAFTFGSQKLMIRLDLWLLDSLYLLDAHSAFLLLEMIAEVRDVCGSRICLESLSLVKVMNACFWIDDGPQKGPGY
jgi:hypothetical protein